MPKRPKPARWRPWTSATRGRGRTRLFRTVVRGRLGPGVRHRPAFPIPPGLSLSGTWRLTPRPQQLVGRDRRGDFGVPHLRSYAGRARAGRQRARSEDGRGTTVARRRLAGRIADARICLRRGRALAPAVPQRTATESIRGAPSTLAVPVPGGSPLLDGVASYLRTAGVQGLVYPSARSDPFVRVSAGDPVTWSGWCFVDYRGTPAQPAEPRVVVNPDSWAELTAGLTVRVAPSDSAQAGSFAVDGNVAAIEEIRRYKTELYYQRRYSTDAEALQPHFHVDNSGEPFCRPDPCFAQDRPDHPRCPALGPRWSYDNRGRAARGGSPRAARSLPRGELLCRPHVVRVSRRQMDAELQIHCMVCDFEQLWPLYMGQNVQTCRDVGSPATARRRRPKSGTASSRCSGIECTWWATLRLTSIPGPVEELLDVSAQHGARKAGHSSVSRTNSASRCSGWTGA